MSDDLPKHLRAILGDRASDRATKAVQDALKRRTEKLSTGRVGRAVKMSGLAMKTGSRLLWDRGPDAPGRGVELAAQMVETLSELRGVGMKLGQMLSYLDDALPAEAKKVLAVLQRDAAPMAWETVRAQIEAELGRTVQQAFREVDEAPLAAASIGQVHRAVTHDGVEVAVKVQYPGIDEAMAADLKNARVLGLFQRMFLFSTDTRAIMAELEERFVDECDYTKEAAYQNAYRARFAGHPDIVVPEVFEDLSAKRVLTTRLYRGQTLYEWLEADPSAEERARVTHRFYRFYIGSFYLDGLFNCDPHPGNYLFCDDGRIVFLDYGCSRRFDPERLGQWVEMCQAVFVDDHDDMRRLATALNFFRPDQAYDFDAFRELLRYLYMPYLTEGEFDWADHPPRDTFRHMFVDNPNLRKLNMPADAVFLNRIGFGLTSLLAEVGSTLNCQRYATHYFQGIDLDWPEDPFRGRVPFDLERVVRPELRVGGVNPAFETAG